jgi:hypothetical protein
MEAATAASPQIVPMIVRADGVASSTVVSALENSAAMMTPTEP